MKCHNLHSWTGSKPTPQQSGLWTTLRGSCSLSTADSFHKSRGSQRNLNMVVADRRGWTDISKHNIVLQPVCWRHDSTLFAFTLFLYTGGWELLCARIAPWVILSGEERYQMKNERELHMYDACTGPDTNQDWTDWYEPKKLNTFEYHYSITTNEWLFDLISATR